MFYVQYMIDTGQIVATLESSHKEAPVMPPGKGQLVLKEWKDTSDKRVNHIMQCLEKCPVIAEAARVAEVHAKIRDVKEQKIDAVMSFLLTGDKAHMQELHEKHETLKKQL